MDMNLAGRTVLVTGASKGIGLVVARWFAMEGCHVCLVARSADLLEEAAKSIRKTSPVKVKTFAADLSDPAARERLVQIFPDVDILVNNAGAIPAGSIEDVDEQAWRAGWELKVYGYIGLTRYYFKLMKERRSGVIINIIGSAGESLRPHYIAGGVGNATLMAFTRSLGSTSADYGIRVVGVNPGPVETERLPILYKKQAMAIFGDEKRWRELLKNLPFGRAATCEEIAALVVFLASDHSAYTTGAIFTVNGGTSMRS
jgi:NAD(P)-dependent dehydrogenase (short-subunit alcohol dehydrogenase family)